MLKSVQSASSISEISCRATRAFTPGVELACVSEEIDILAKQAIRFLASELCTFFEACLSLKARL